MWLPKNERKLLASYYSKAKKPNVTLRFPDNLEPMKALGYKEFEQKQSNVENNPFFARVWDANENLNYMGLIKFQGNCERSNPQLRLTNDGWKLARKCSSKLGRVGLFCAEYVWLWVILGAIMGAITLAVTIFKD